MGLRFTLPHENRMLSLGCAGLVTDGLVRDTWEIKHTGFPIYAAGRTPADCRGRLEYEDHNCPLTVGGVSVKPGDLLLADAGGVIVVPSEVLEKVLEVAEQHAKKHDWIHAQVRSGRRAGEVVGTYDRQAGSGT